MGSKRNFSRASITKLDRKLSIIPGAWMICNMFFGADSFFGLDLYCIVSIFIPLYQCKVVLSATVDLNECGADKVLSYSLSRD